MSTSDNTGGDTTTLEHAKRVNRWLRSTDLERLRGELMEQCATLAARVAEIARLRAEVERLTPKKPAGVESPLFIWHERHEAHHGGCPFCRNPEPAPTPKPPPDYWIVRGWCGPRATAHYSLGPSVYETTPHRRRAAHFATLEAARADCAEWDDDMEARVIAVWKRART